MGKQAILPVVRQIGVLFVVCGLALLLSPLPTAHAATLTVTTTADNTTADGACTLREAILAANGAPANSDCGSGTAGLDTIAFNIPAGQCGADGVCIITLSGNLPTVTEAVTIDGTTQPQYGTAPTNVCATSSAPSYMRVEVRGGGLYIDHASGSSTMRGLSLVDPAAEPISAAVRVRRGSGHRIQCNHVGVNGPGTSLVGTTNYGVAIELNASGVIIGTDGDGSKDLAERNVFGGGFGVYINANNENVIAGNYFGFGADGTTPLSIVNAIFMRQSSGQNLVGTNWDGISDELERNVIGNTYTGVEIASWSSAGTNSVVGNWIGLNAAGAPAPCSGRGIYLNTTGAGSPTDTIINGNTIGRCPRGILLDGEGVDDTLITGNYIGVAPDGTSLGMDYGIWIGQGADSTTIGDGTLIGANFIGNANQAGIYISGNNSVTGTAIIRNFIGVGPGGINAGNGTGIWFNAIQSGDRGTAVFNNTIGYNTNDGIAILTTDATPAQIAIVDNFIGTDSAAAFANYANGRGLRISDSGIGANSHWLSNNLFAHNEVAGVFLADDTSFSSGSVNNCFIGNAIGFHYRGSIWELGFEYNWWNAADGPSGEGPGSGDSVQYDPFTIGTLDFTPWLTSDDGTICDVLLNNGSMEDDADGNKVPDFWKIKTPSGKSMRKCDNPAKGKFYAHTGSCAVVLQSTGAREKLQQTYTPSGGGLAGDLYTLSLWASGKSIPAGAIARVTVQFAYTDGTKEKFTLNLPTGTYAYQQFQLDAVAAKDYTSVKVKVEYAASGGKLIVDDVSFLVQIVT